MTASAVMLRTKLSSWVNAMTEQNTALGLGSPTSPVTPAARTSALQPPSAAERAVTITCTRACCGHVL